MNSYIHIPFCEQKCKYCRFALTTNFDRIKIARYIAYLCREIEKFYHPDNLLKTLYFWGGTPWVLSENELATIFQAMRKKFIFDENIEISLETTPDKISLENINIWKNLGVTRLSMGVQSLNEKTLKEVLRTEQKAIFNALDTIQKSNFKNVNIDFILGLPYATKQSTKQDIATLIEKYPNISHISVYMLEDFYYGEKWKKVCMPEEDFWESYAITKRFLKEKGFQRYELSNFAKKGFECTHNRGYWSHANCIGFGLDAHSYLDGVRFSNSDDFTYYYARKWKYNERLTEDEKFHENLLFSLRMWGFHEKISEKLDTNAMGELIAEGFLEKKKKMITLTEKWVPLLDFILKKLI